MASFIDARRGSKSGPPDGWIIVALSKHEDRNSLGLTYRLANVDANGAIRPMDDSRQRQLCGYQELPFARVSSDQIDNRKRELIRRLLQQLHIPQKRPVARVGEEVLSALVGP